MKEKGLVIIKENKTTVAVIAAAVGALVALMSIIAYKATHKKMVIVKGDEAVENSDCTSVQ